MSFFNIVPRDKEYLGYTINSIPLTVIQDDEIEVKPNINIKTNELNDGYVQFYDTGSRGEVFKISIIMHKNDTIDGVKGETNITPYWKYNKENNKPFTPVNSVKKEYTGKVKLIDLLDYIIRGMIPVMIVTDAIDIPNNQLYYITENGSRKQSHREYTKWELTFQTYDPLKLVKYKNNNINVINAIKRATAAHKKATSNKTNTSASSTNSKFRKCSVSVLKYSKSKKVVTCVKYMQKLLKKRGFYSGKVDGWFGSLTVKAVKAFQKKYKKKYGLKVTGKVDTKTKNGISKL